MTDLLRNPNIDSKSKKEILSKAEEGGGGNSTERATEFLMDVGARSRYAQEREFKTLNTQSRRLT